MVNRKSNTLSTSPPSCHGEQEVTLSTSPPSCHGEQEVKYSIHQSTLLSWRTGSQILYPPVHPAAMVNRKSNTLSTSPPNCHGEQEGKYLTEVDGLCKSGSASGANVSFAIFQMIIF